MAIIKSNQLTHNSANITLLYGAPGVGKTTLAGEFPKPLLFLECGLDGGRKVLYNKPEVFFEEHPVKPDKTNIDSVDILYNKLYQYATDGTILQFKTIVIDPLTALMLETRAHKELAKDGKALTFDEQAVIKNNVYKLLLLLHQIRDTYGINIVLVTHETIKELELANGVRCSVYMPYLSTGMLKDVFNSIDNVIRIKVLNDKRVMSLSDTHEHKAKCRYKVDTLGKLFEASYTNISKLSNGDMPEQINDKKGVL